MAGCQGGVRSGRKHKCSRISHKISDFVIDKIPDTLEQAMYLAILGESIANRRRQKQSDSILVLQEQIKSLHQDTAFNKEALKRDNQSAAA